MNTRFYELRTYSMDIKIINKFVTFHVYNVFTSVQFFSFTVSSGENSNNFYSP